MSTFSSTQLAVATAAGNQFAEGNRDINARVRYDRFTFTVPAVTNIGDVINLAKLPKGARLIAGLIRASASLGGTATVALGTDKDLLSGADDTTVIPANAANLLGATAGAGTGSGTKFADTLALGADALATAPTNIIATVGVAALAPGVVIVGYVLYTVN